MDSKIRNRVLEMANMILENNTTVRDVAKRIGYSKSTVQIGRASCRERV